MKGLHYQFAKIGARTFGFAKKTKFLWINLNKTSTPFSSSFSTFLWDNATALSIFLFSSWSTKSCFLLPPPLSFVPKVSTHRFREMFWPPKVLSKVLTPLVLYRRFWLVRFWRGIWPLKILKKVLTLQGSYNKDLTPWFDP